MSPRFRLVAALLPVLGLSALVVRGELAKHGAEFRLTIRGYDPRDLIAGHYLRYQYELDWQGASSCGVARADDGFGVTTAPSLSPGCCLCLTQQGPPPSSPAVRQVSCAAARSCDGWVRAELLEPPQRYYVPEERARELERALMGRKAAVDAVTSGSGTVAVGELYIDGVPWRMALEEEAEPEP